VTEYARTGEPWLLGNVGSAVIPPSWAKYRHVHSSLVLLDGSQQADHGVEALATRALVTVSNCQSIDWSATAEGFAQAISDAAPEWLALEVADSSDFSGWTLSDLPLKSSTRLVLEVMRLDGSAPLDKVVCRRRDEFGRYEGGWVALLDLSIALECWWPVREQSPIHVVQSQAHSLEEIAAALVREYLTMDGNRLGDEWVEYILRRHSWGMSSATLDAIGQDAGLTRERVRQIIARLESSVGGRTWPLPAVLADAVEEVRDHDFHHVQRTLLEAGLVTDEDWTPEELVLLIRWFGYPRLAGSLAAAFEESNRRYSDPGAVKAIRNARSKIGLIRLDSVALPNGSLMDPNFAKDITKQTYGRVYECDGWLLAGDEGSTMLEGGSGRQFYFSHFLDASELYDGLIRIQKNRSLPALPSQDVVFDLLKKSGAIVASATGFTGPGLAPEVGSLNSWLATLLLGADGCVLHKESINRAAIRDKVNISSLGVYYGYSPVVRNCGDGRGLIRLVGRTPTSDDLEHAVHVAEVLRVQSQIDWQVSDGATQLTLQMGSNFIASGVLQSVPKALLQIWPTGGAAICCTCAHAFSGRISAYGGSALIGWSPLLAHLFLEHDVKEGDVLSLELRDSHLQLKARARPE